MPADVQAILVYWPVGAAALALIIAVFAAGWFSISAKGLKLQLEAVAANKKSLQEARVAAKEKREEADARLAEMTKLHDEASKLFWRNEKTWIG